MDLSSELPDTVIIATDVVTQLERRAITFRLFGSCAVWLLCVPARPLLRDLHRVPKDIDGMVPSASVGDVIRALSDEGWRDDEDLRAWSENTRLRFSHPAKPLLLDVSVDQLRFAQTLDVRGRFHLNPCCLTQTDVFLSKLQIVNATRDDLIDMTALLYSFELGNSEETDLCLSRVRDITGKSWRWWKAARTSIEALRQWSGSPATTAAAVNQDVQRKAAALMTEIERGRQGLRWHLEALGGRISGTWFNNVEEP